MLSSLFANLMCKVCKTSSFRVVLGGRYGLSHKIKVECDVCKQLETETYTSQRMTKSDGTLRKTFDINMRVAQAFLGFGKGYLALEIFCMYTNMHLMSGRIFNRYKKFLLDSITYSSTKIIQKVRNKIRKEYGISYTHEFADIAVSFDGTWLTRGHTSQIGVGCVIDILTGYVIDYEVMSKHCTKCEYAKTNLGEKSAEYSIWYDGHKTSCSINHIGTSGAMEMAAAYKLWSRCEKMGLQQFFQTVMQKHLNI
ncbi:hypothetical protein AVEN_253386-1 [Araneus ventricosus]|uniref:Mutator-like transposase domain-containing protein n=1 Tax=Araneus ventricosus TaxID=182803 RepID=A0A4Y2QVS1_ARAVE|nr:hypothetical protein AVEN_253386-1 [Araneus ventricosus]